MFVFYICGGFIFGSLFVSLFNNQAVFWSFFMVHDGLLPNVSVAVFIYVPRFSLVCSVFVVWGTGVL